ncbi:MAG: hypothetical protein KDA36_05750 [Planctomycetaceae bacterium]|nr:hypothetical protein [Planctomycetaceae bacterium]
MSRIMVGRLAWVACCIAMMSANVRADEPGKVGNKGIRQDGLVAMNKQGTVLVDKAGKRVLLKTKVVLRKGALELFCCLKETKEHESIVSVDARAQDVHAALLLVGAEPGSPCRYDPKFIPPKGPIIDLFVQWIDEQGKLHREKGQSWIRGSTQRYFVAPLEELPENTEIEDETDLRYDKKHRELFWFGVMNETQKTHWSNQSDDEEYQKAIAKIFFESQIKEMNADWVFAGSYFGKDEVLKEEFYAAEDGDLICVSNFSNATLDVNGESVNNNAALLYEAYTERIPALETEVTLELVPRVEKGK